ncbi:MAG: hypothetical protein Q7S91_00175, partial [Aquabacterium sp.]|nr:hypothetical protein [Aquabacterium sp.]
RAGHLLERMVPSIHKTSTLVQEIAAASGQQSDGVGQINSAMSHLNSTTQQTAAASEELSATAEELSAQANRLQELMAFFRLAQDSGRPTAETHAAHAARPPAPRAAALSRPFAARPPVPAAANARQAPAGANLPGLTEVDEASFTRF